MAFELENINEIQLDALKELANICAGNSTTALATMLNEEIMIKVPDAELIDISDISEVIGDPEKDMVCILMDMFGDVNGMILYLFEVETRDNIVNRIMENYGMAETYADDEKDYRDMELSVITEVGNIISGAYIRTFTSMTGFDVRLSMPVMEEDMVGAVLSIAAIKMGEKADKVLFIETSFKENSDLNGYYIFIPDTESYEKILKKFSPE